MALNRRVSQRAAWVIASFLLVGIAAFAIGRGLGDRQGVDSRVEAADPTAKPPSVDADVPPIPGAPVDTSKPGWWEPYLNADQAKPRVEQTVNGIKLGPNVVLGGHNRCTPGEARYADITRVEGTPVNFEPRYLPVDSHAQQNETVECRGVILSHFVDYAQAPEPDAVEKLRRGDSYFKVRHGGTFSIGRAYREQPAHVSLVASERWVPMTIGGFPAAVGRPILDEGLGQGEVVVWDASQGILTLVRTQNFSLAKMLQIARGLYQ